MQWIDGVLSKGEKMDFFHDEFDCPVYVKDVVAIIRALTSRWISGIILQYQSLNTGNIDDKTATCYFFTSSFIWFLHSGYPSSGKGRSSLRCGPCGNIKIAFCSTIPC